MKVYIFLADGFEETEALVPWDLLIRAGADVTTVSINGGVSVTPGPALTSPESTLGDPGKGAKNDLENGSGDGTVTNSPRGDAGQVTALVDSGVGVVVIGKSLRVGFYAARVAELHVRVGLGSLDHKVLVAVGIAEDHGTAGLYQVLAGRQAGVVLRHVPFDDELLF